MTAGRAGKRSSRNWESIFPISTAKSKLSSRRIRTRTISRGLVEAARNYKIGKVLTTAAEKDTQVFKEWQDVLNYNKIETLEVWRGTEVKFDDANMKIVGPPGKVDPNVGEANDKSVVARLDYGENSFLFTGDIESGAEKEIVESGENIDVDVLKVAHHGSKYSSSEAFLDAASPEDAQSFPSARTIPTAIRRKR